MLRLTVVALAVFVGATVPASSAATATHLGVLGARSGVAAGLVASGSWRPDHVVIVLEENHSYKQIITDHAAPYIDQLANTSASMTNSHAITHPSQPNYLALFSGSTHGIVNDTCPHTFGSRNLGSELGSAGLSFTGYSESMPSVGYTGCKTATYARKHNPAPDFTDLPGGVNQPFAAFPYDYSQLPTVSYVVPNLQHDMHDGTVRAADSWLRTHFDRYVTWAKAHNSLLILTWDEGAEPNQIPTVFAGAHVKPGDYAEHVDHYNVLATVQDMYGLPPLGVSAERSPITDIFDNTANQSELQGVTP